MLVVNELLKVFSSYYHFLYRENLLRITSIFAIFPNQRASVLKRQLVAFILFQFNAICNLLHNKSDAEMTKNQWNFLRERLR